MTAGAVHTPHVLMLSGLGDANALREVGLKCEVSLPGLGKNLQDHPACLSAFTLKPSAGAISITDHLLTKTGRLRAGAVLNYALRRKGPLTSTGCDHGAFVSTGPALLIWATTSPTCRSAWHRVWRSTRTASARTSSSAGSPPKGGSGPPA